jgi:hypothetical protein
MRGQYCLAKIRKAMQQGEAVWTTGEAEHNSFVYGESALGESLFQGVDHWSKRL